MLSLFYSALLYLLNKVSADRAHIIKLLLSKIRPYAIETVGDPLAAYLVGKVAVIVYLAERLRYLIPIYATLIGSSE